MKSGELKGADEIMQALEEIAEKMGAGSVAVGFMEGATYPDDDSPPVAAVAFSNEYGGPNRPPRPFFRRMIAKESGTWPDKMGKLAEATDCDGARVLALMGEDVGGALAQSIIEFTTPKLSDYTINKKGFNKPLIDTAVMIRAITYQVNDDSPVPTPVSGNIPTRKVGGGK